MEYDFKDLEVFCQVVERGSFSLAARAVHLAQATVSERIAALEEKVGTQLLDRLGRQSVPTRAGKLLYRRARDQLELRRRTNLELEALRDVHRGWLAIGGSTLPGDYLLPGAIARFRRQYPAVTVTATIGDSQGIADRVVDGTLELAVVGAHERSSHLTATRLWQDELVLVVPRAHPWARRKTVEVAALGREPLILRPAGSGTRRLFAEQLRRAHGIELDALTIAAELGSTTAVKQAVACGLGVAVLSTRAIAAELAAGQLACLRLRGLRLERSFALIRDRRRSRSPLAVALSRFLTDGHDS